MVTILQLSDIHFRHPEGSIFDLHRELQTGLIRFLPALQEEVGEFDLIVVAGDVAFGGTADQYAKAEGFLRDIRSRLQKPGIPVRVIPGNHDIHRPDTNTADQRKWRGSVRGTMEDHERDEALNGMLQEALRGDGLLKPLNAFNEFAATYESLTSRERPHWERTFALQPGWTLRVRGLNSVLISNENDDTDQLILGSMQLTDWQREPGEVTLTLCHHPYCWLVDGHLQHPRIRAESHVHITGHVHRHAVRPHPNHDPSHVHLMAGALQPPHKEKGVPRFNALRISVDEAGAESKVVVGVTPVVWVAGDHRFQIDRANRVTHKLPVEPLEGSRGADQPPADSAALDRLAERFATLPFSDQLSTVQAIEMSVADVVQRPAHEIVGAVIESAHQHDRLAELWREIHTRHGEQSGDDNPFEVSS